MPLNKDLIDKIINVTSTAAMSCYKFVGKNQKENADKAATDTMRNEINKIDINGEVVIGEGELDEAPMLYIGEKLGKGGFLNLDIAAWDVTLIILSINSLFKATKFFLQKFFLYLS